MRPRERAVSGCSPRTGPGTAPPHPRRRRSSASPTTPPSSPTPSRSSGSVSSACPWVARSRWPAPPSCPIGSPGRRSWPHPGRHARMHPAYPRDDLDESGRRFFDDLARGDRRGESRRARAPTSSPGVRRSVRTTPTTRRLRQRWLSSLPDEDRAPDRRPGHRVAAAAREAIGVPERLPVRRRPRVRAVAVRPRGRPVPGDPLVRRARRQRASPQRRVAGRAARGGDLTVLPGLGHLESLVRTWGRILASFAEPG